MNIRSVLKAQVQAQQLRDQLNNYARDKSEEMRQKQIKDVKNYETPIPGPLPSNEEINKNTNIKTEQQFLEESLAVASENLKAARENDEKEQQKIITDITDPTPGAVVKDFFDDDDVDNNQFKTTTNRPIELNDYDKKIPLITVKKGDDIEPLTFKDNLPSIVDIPGVKLENPVQVKTPPPDYTYYPNNLPNIVQLPDDDEEIFKPKIEPEDIFIDDDDITMQLPKMEVDGKTEIKPANTEIELKVLKK